MGEIAEMMLGGDMCERCGEFMDGGSGFARLCAGCRGGATSEAAHRKPHKCPHCPRRFRKAFAVKDHVRDKHAEGEG
jgi:hypothetical protein